MAFVLAMARYLMYRENYRRFGAAGPLGRRWYRCCWFFANPTWALRSFFCPCCSSCSMRRERRSSISAALACAAWPILPLLWSQMSRAALRVTRLFEQTSAGQKPSPDGYQLHQAKQLLRPGFSARQLVGGEASDDRAAYHLPESHTDFIFTVLGERYGWFGLAGVLILFAVLVGRALTDCRANSANRLADCWPSAWRHFSACKF